MPKLGFREIAAAIRAEIVEEGRHPTGSVLPAVPVLAARFGASASLVNRAMQILAAEGLVRPERGRGTVVTWLRPLVYSPARFSRSIREGGGAKGAFDAEIKARGLEPKHDITTEHAAPPAEVAEAFGLPVDEVNCLVRRRLLSASGIPIRVNESWFPLQIAEGTVLEEPGPVIVGGVKSALAELGYQQTEAEDETVVRLPTQEEVDALEISPERTVLDILHIGRTAEGHAVEVTRMITPAHYLVMKSTYPLA